MANPSPNKLIAALQIRLEALEKKVSSIPPPPAPPPPLHPPPRFVALIDVSRCSNWGTYTRALEELKEKGISEFWLFTDQLALDPVTDFGYSPGSGAAFMYSRNMQHVMEQAVLKWKDPATTFLVYTDWAPTFSGPHLTPGRGRWQFIINM